MAFNVSNLAKFVDETGSLVSAAILEAQVMTLGATVIPGIKAGSGVALNKVSEEIFPKALGCGFSASGDTVYSQTIITPAGFKVDKIWCPSDLFPKYVAQKMAMGTHQEDFTESEFIFDLVTKNIRKFNDKLVFQGAVASGDLINGFLTQLTALGTGRTSTASAYTAVTASNVVAMVNELYSKFIATNPALLGESDIVLVISPENFALYTQALRTLNLFNYGQQNDTFATGISIPGTNVTVRPMNGMVGTPKAFITTASNMVVVLDGISDEDILNVWWSEDNQEIRGVAKWTLGVGFFTDTVVCNW